MIARFGRCLVFLIVHRSTSRSSWWPLKTTVAGDLYFPSGGLLLDVNVRELNENSGR